MYGNTEGVTTHQSIIIVMSMLWCIILNPHHCITLWEVILQLSWRCCNCRSVGVGVWVWEGEETERKKKEDTLPFISVLSTFHVFHPRSAAAHTQSHRLKPFNSIRDASCLSCTLLGGFIYLIIFMSDCVLGGGILFYNHFLCDGLGGVVGYWRACPSRCIPPKKTKQNHKHLIWRSALQTTN